MKRTKGAKTSVEGLTLDERIAASYRGVGARMTAEPTADPVNQPSHYRSHPSGVECIEIVQHMNFCRGNAIKYIWRAGAKGNEVEDLRKAIRNLEIEIQRLENARK